MALQGRTIVSSIHQPRSSIYALFDDIALLSEGKMMYYGEASKLVDYFASLGHVMPENFNPADFALDLVSVDIRNEELEKETKERLKDLRASFVAQSQVLLVEPAENEEDTSDQTRKRKYETSRLTQFIYLAQRAARQRMRDKIILIIPLFTTTFFALLLGFLYFQTGSDLTQQAVIDKFGSFFFLALNQWMSGMFATLSVFPKQKMIVSRERASKSYALSPFYISKVLVDLPMILYPTIFTIIFYFLAGYSKDPGTFFATLCLAILAYLTAISFGMFISAFAGSLLQAQGMAMPIMLIFILFSGFYANNSVIPAALNWIQWISPMRWIFAGIVVVQFSGLVFQCDAATAATQGCIPTGEAFIDSLGLQNDSFARSLGVLLGMMVFLHISAYLALRFKKVRYIVPKRI